MYYRGVNDISNQTTQVYKKWRKDVTMKEINIMTEEIATEDLSNVTTNSTGSEKELGAAAIAGITLVSASAVGFILGMSAVAASQGKKMRQQNIDDIKEGMRQYDKEKKKKDKKKQKKADKAAQQNQQQPNK